MEVLPPNLTMKEVALMNGYEVINVVIGIIGLVLTAIAVGITTGKKNRH